ncbi:MAG: redoxin domain-containing protein [Planctomycetaceae bacterium]
MASVYVPATQLGEPLTLMLKRICEINGTCLLEGIKERIPVGLSVEDREGRPLAGVATVTSVAENGLRVQFKLRLPPGEYRLQSPHSTAHSTISIPLRVPEGQRSLHLEEQVIKPNGITALIGKPAPPLKGVWRDGEETTLDALRGNVVVLDFWGYWCQPCLAGMPRLMDIADEFKDRPVKWLAIHDPHALTREELDAKLAEIAKSVWQGRALTFPVMIDAATDDDDRTGVTGERYDVREWPTLIVIDRDGHVAGAVTHDRLREKIQSLLPEKRQGAKKGADNRTPAGAIAAVDAEKQAAAKSQNIVIAGRVTDPDGKPAAGAMVMLPMNLGWNEPRRVVQGVTDGEGKYSLSVPSEWLGTPMYSAGGTLWAYQPGFALATASVFKQLDPSQPRGDVDLTLPPDSKPKYRFVDEAGKPLADGTASIAYYRSAVGYEPVPQEILERIPATGDADGNVTFVAVESGKLWRIKVRTDRHGTQSFRVDGSPVGAQFRLHAAVPVRGHITGDNPEWIKNVRLNLSTGWDIPGTLIEPEGEAEVRTDESGRFEVPLLATGSLTISEFLDQSLPVRLEIPNRPMPVPTETPLEFRLVPAQKVKGRVVRKAGGAPVAGVHVHVGYGHFRQSDSAVTNANGEFEAGALPGQVYQQVLLIPDKSLEQVGSPWSERYEIPRSEEPFQLPTIELVGTHTQSGRLVDDAGKPLAKHMVWSVAGNRGYGFANTEANGEFELRIPDGVEVERYGFNSPADEMGEGVVVTSEPLLLRAKPYERRKQAGAALPAAVKPATVAIAEAATESTGESDSGRDAAATAAEAKVETEFLVTDEQQRPIPSGALELRGYYDNGDSFEQERAIKAGRATFEFQRTRLREFVVSLSATGFRSYLRLWVRKDGFVPLHAMWSKGLTVR